MKWVRDRLSERSTHVHLFNCAIGIAGLLAFGPSMLIIVGLVALALLGAMLPDKPAEK